MKNAIKILLIFYFVPGLSSFVVSQSYTLGPSLYKDGSLAYVTLNYNSGKSTLSEINSDANIDWEVSLPGSPTGMGRVSNDLGIIYQKGNSYFYTTANPETKTVANEKLIFNKPGDQITLAYTLYNSSKNLLGVVFRTLPANINFGGSVDEIQSKLAQTESLDFVPLTTGSDFKEIKIRSACVQSNCISILSDGNSGFYVISYTDQDITAERFSSAGNPIARIKYPLAINTKKPVDAIATCNNETPNCVDVGMAYVDNSKNVFIPIIRFDFDKNQAFASEPVELDKQYYNSLKSFANGDKLPYLKDVTGLIPIDILYTQGKIIYVKEISNYTTYSHFRMGSVISVYSKELKLLREIPINKSCSTMSGTFDCIGARVNKDTLYAVVNESGLSMAHCELLKININDGNTTRQDIDKKRISGIIDLPNILWFDKSFVLPERSTKFSLKSPSTYSIKLFAEPY